MANMGALGHEIGIGVATALLQLKDDGFFENINKASSAMQNFQSGVNSQTSSLEKFSSVTSNIGSSMTKNITLPLVNLGKSSLNTFKDMESAFTGVRKTIDDSKFDEAFGKNVDGFKVLDDAIKKIAQSTNSSYEEVAKVMEWAGQLNVPLGKGGESIIKFTENMVKLGDSTNLTAEQSSESLAKFLNIVEGGAPEAYMDIDKLGSVIVKLGNNSATTESDIVNMAMRLAGAGKQIGLTETEILGFASALSSVGITAEMGGSAFSKAMVKMQVAAETGYEPIIELQERTGLSLREMELMSTNDSKSFMALADSLGMTTTELKKTIKAGNNLNDFAAIANMTTEDFVRLYRDDATAALQAFIGGLGDTESHGQTAIAMLDEMGFTEVRLRDVLLRLSGAQNIVSDNIKMANAEWEENHALTEEANKRYETLEAKLNQLNERWKEMQYSIAEALIPVLSKLMDILEKVIGWWNGLSEGTKDFIVQAGLVVAAVGPVLSILGKLSGSIVNIHKAFELVKNLGIVTHLKDVGSVAETAAGGIGKAGKAFEGLGGIIGTVIKTISGIALAIGGSILAIVEFVDMWENGWNVISTILEALGLALAAIGAVILGAPAAVAAAVAGIVFAISQLAIVIHDNWDAIQQWGRETWESIKEGWNNFVEWFKELWNNVVQWFTGIGEGIANAFNNAVDWIKEKWENFLDWFDEVWDNFSSIIETVCNAISDFFSNAVDWITEKWNIFSEWFKGLWNNITQEFREKWNLVLEFFSGIIDTIVDKWNYFKEWFLNLWNGLVDTLKGIFDGLFDFISGWFRNVFSNVSEFFSNLFSKIKESFDNIIGKIREFFSNLWDDVTNWFENFINGVRDFFGKLGNVLSDLFNKLKDTIVKLFNTLVEVVQKLIDVVKESISTFVDTITSLVNAAKELINSIIESVKSIVENIIEIIKNLISNVKKALEELWEKITTVFKDTFEKVKEFMKKKFEDLIDWFKKIPSKFEEVGKSIINGLWSGLKSAWTSVVDWIGEKINWVVDKLKELTGYKNGVAKEANKYSGSHAGGLDYVPYNGYIAQLHEGERVLTKQEARDYNNGNNNSGGDIFNFYNVQPDPYEYARQMKRTKKELLLT